MRGCTGSMPRSRKRIWYARWCRSSTSSPGASSRPPRSRAAGLAPLPVRLVVVAGIRRACLAHRLAEQSIDPLPHLFGVLHHVEGRPYREEGGQSSDDDDDEQQHEKTEIEKGQHRSSRVSYWMGT